VIIVSYNRAPTSNDDDDVDEQRNDLHGLTVISKVMDTSSRILLTAVTSKSSENDDTSLVADSLVAVKTSKPQRRI
jgi:hypothetical protein